MYLISHILHLCCCIVHVWFHISLVLFPAAGEALFRAASVCICRAVCGLPHAPMQVCTLGIHVCTRVETRMRHNAVHECVCVCDVHERVHAVLHTCDAVLKRQGCFLIMYHKRKRWGDNPFRSLHSSRDVQSKSTYAEIADGVEHAGQMLRHTLIARYVSGKMSGEDMSLIAWWATKAGAVGVHEFALDPDTKNKARNRTVLDNIKKEFTPPSLYELKTPMVDKVKSIRSMETVEIQLAHERLADVKELPSTNKDRQSAWWDSFDKHPVVEQARRDNVPPESIIPIGLYWDGIRYTKNDTAVAFYFNDMRAKKIFVLHCTSMAKLSTDRSSVRACLWLSARSEYSMCVCQRFSVVV